MVAQHGEGEADAKYVACESPIPRDAIMGLPFPNDCSRF